MTIYRMGDAGILDEEEPIELLDGEIVYMARVGPRHAATNCILTHLFCLKFSDDAGYAKKTVLASNNKIAPLAFSKKKIAVKDLLPSVKNDLAASLPLFSAHAVGAFLSSVWRDFKWKDKRLADASPTLVVHSR